MYRALFAVLTLLMVSGCQKSSPPKKEYSQMVQLVRTHLGQNYLDHIQEAEGIAIVKVKPQPADKSQGEKQSIELDQGDVLKMKEILLNDNSYQFAFQKKCLFLEEYLLKFHAKGEEMQLFYSPACKQFKYPHAPNRSGDIIEIDPSAKQIEMLINKYTKQFEVNDEHNSSSNK